MPDHPKRHLAVFAALALVAAGALALASPVRADGGDARVLLARSLGAFERGNHSAARALARQAVAADPAWALAHAVLARMALTEGDGVTAEAELGRARDAGFDMRRTVQLMGEARLLQGDPAGAITAARATAPRYAAYGLRIQARATAAQGDAVAAAALFDRAIDRAPSSSGAWTDLARFRTGIGDTAGAVAAAARATALDPMDLDALTVRAGLVRDQFGLAAAIPWFEAALARDPHSYDALIGCAATLGDAGRSRDMLAAARRALAVRPDDARTLYLLSVLAARGGRLDLARDLFERTGDALDGIPGPLLLAATLDLDAGDNEQAVTKLRNLVAIQPMNVAARQLLTGALLRTGAARDALAVIGPVATRDDADSYSLTLAARALERSGKRADAAGLLDRASRPAVGGAASFASDDSVATLAAAASGLAPGEPSTAIPLVRALLGSGDRTAALARANAVASANRGSPAAASVLGDTLMALGRFADAAKAYGHAADLLFDEPTMLRLTEARQRAGDPAGAASALAAFLSQNPRNVAALRLAAHWQIAAGDHAAAIATLEGLRARLGDRDAALLAELAYAYDGAGEDTVARSYAAAAYALAPANAAAADAYGWTLYGAGDLDGARQLIEKAVTLAPAHATLRWHLAQLYADLGRSGEARTQAQAALRDPAFTEREAARRLAGAA